MIWDLVFCVRPLWEVGNWETHAVANNLNYYIDNQPKSIGVGSKNLKNEHKSVKHRLKKNSRIRTKIWKAKKWARDTFLEAFWHHVGDFGCNFGTSCHPRRAPKSTFFVYNLKKVEKWRHRNHTPKNMKFGSKIGAKMGGLGKQNRAFRFILFSK